MDGQYNNPYDYNQYNTPFQQPQKPMWASITSFVLSLVNIIFCCCGTYVFAPLSIIFGIVSLAKKWAGKGLAIAGVIISSITLVITIASSIVMNTVFKEPYEDMMKFVINADKYVQEYQETGDVPEDFQKYCDPEYDGWWKSMGYDSFEDFYDDYMEGFMSGYQSSGGNRYNNYDDDYYDDDDDDYNDRFFDDFGEKPVDL